MFDGKAVILGDEKAFEEAIADLSPELFRYAVGILLSHTDAEDAVQNAYISLWQKRSTIRNPNAVRAYLYKSTYRACVDLMRKKKILIPVIQTQEKKPLTDELREALARLTVTERAIVYERAVAETSYSELAERLGMREENIRKKYERARKKLAKCLADEWKE